MKSFQSFIICKAIAFLITLLFLGASAQNSQAQPPQNPHSDFVILNVAPVKDQSFPVSTPTSEALVSCSGNGTIRAQYSNYIGVSTLRILQPSDAPVDPNDPDTSDPIVISVSSTKPVNDGTEIPFSEHFDQSLPVGKYIIEFRLHAHYPPNPTEVNPVLVSTDVDNYVKNPFSIDPPAIAPPVGGGGGPRGG